MLLPSMIKKPDLFRGCLASTLVILLFLGCNSKSEEKVRTYDLKNDNLPATAIDRDSIVFEMVAEDSTTVFDLTVTHHAVQYDKSSSGYFVAAINSIEQGNDYFWIYAVNDTMGNVASNKREILPGDRVVWHYRLITR